MESSSTSSISSDNLDPSIISSEKAAMHTCKSLEYDPTKRASLQHFLKQPIIKQNILNHEGNLYFLDEDNRSFILLPRGNFAQALCITVEGPASISLEKSLRIYLIALPTIRQNVAQMQAGKYDEELPHFSAYEVNPTDAKIAGISDNLKKTVDFQVTPKLQQTIKEIIGLSEDKLVGKKAYGAEDREISKKPQFFSWDPYDPTIVSKASKLKFWKTHNINRDNIKYNGFWSLAMLWKTACDTSHKFNLDSKIDITKSIADTYNEIFTSFKTNKEFCLSFKNPKTRLSALQNLKVKNDTLLKHWRTVLQKKLKLRQDTHGNFATPEKVKDIEEQYQPYVKLIQEHLAIDKFLNKNANPEEHIESFPNLE